MNHSTPVTICIPFYNAESTLLEAVRSVFAQTHKTWELILIDDGSTDGSLAIAQSISDPRVKVYSDGQNRRLAARLNELVEIAQYDFIARMDADDMMTPDRVQKLLDILLTNEKYDLASCGTYSIRQDGSFNGYRGADEHNYTFNKLLNKSQGFLHAGLIARKSWYQRNRYDESLPVGQDSELWLRAARAGDFRAISLKEPLYLYREEGNVTLQKIIRAYQAEREHHAPLIDKRSKRLKYIAKSVLKTGVVQVMASTGTLDYLLKRRNKKSKQTKVPDPMLEIFNQALDSIYSTKIPGIDHV
ncbi:glycosyltransferase family 2 protein [uncultured Psychrobacter sp.]|uniref:glycosyltransferase family 2 protein n=1 Tax=Psychrobacter sp. DM8 TaxID=3440636 RepID=UPI00293D4536|nr:glycosyltransferase family 2 protein [uncultured Psychrobacter sp.]